MVTVKGCAVTAIAGQDLDAEEIEILFQDINARLACAREGFSAARAEVSNYSVTERDSPDPSDFCIPQRERLWDLLREARSQNAPES